MIFTLRNGGGFVQRFKRNKKITYIFLVKRMRSTKYNMEYYYRYGRHELAISLTTIYLVTEF